MKKIFFYITAILITNIGFLPLLECKLKLIDFNFNDTELTDIIKILAETPGEEKNIILPQGANAIKQKVNIHLPEKISIKKAWEYVATFLNLAGYTMITHIGMDQVVKNDINSNRDTLPIYVGFNPQDFPHTENKIRAIVYLTNLKVPEKYDEKSPDPINQILTDMLASTKSVVYDQKSNAIIAADSANKLATAFNIIMLLDRSGDPNVVEVIQLYNTDATGIAELVKTQILALTGDQKGALKADVKSETGLYFGSGTVHLIADNRLNSIILTGAGPAIERLRDLISMLDQPAESGKSILHVYELQYLEADKFAPVLANLVKGGTETAQSTKDAQGNTNKLFEGVIVLAESKLKETVKKYDAPTGEAALGTLKGEEIERGGNRIIVTARSEDWLRIKELIISLDIPQPIIIVEVLVIDVTINETKILGAQLRNLNAENIAKGITEQSAFLNNPILNTVVTGGIPTVVPEPAKLAADLLSLVFPASASVLTPKNAFSIAQNLTTPVTGSPGSLIMSFNDPNGSGIWGVLQVLDSFSDLKVLSHPFLVAKNNMQAETVISTIRRDQGQAFAGQAAVVSQKIEDIEARLRVGVVPRVSSIDRVNMQVAIDVQEFTSNLATDYTRNTRTVNTNSNISSGQVLALGGLGTLTETESTSKIPILSDIPIIGPLFQQSRRTTSQVNLLILITPTIIQPKIRGGIEIYTRDKVAGGFEVFETQSVIGNPRDPVTHWFFKSKIEDAKETANVYLAEAEGDFVVEFQNARQQKRDNTKPRRTRRRGGKTPTKETAPRVNAKTYRTESKFGI